MPKNRWAGDSFSATFTISIPEKLARALYERYGGKKRLSTARLRDAIELAACSATGPGSVLLSALDKEIAAQEVDDTLKKLRGANPAAIAKALGLQEVDVIKRLGESDAD